MNIWTFDFALNPKVVDVIEQQLTRGKGGGEYVYAFSLGGLTKIGSSRYPYERLSTHLRNARKQYGEMNKFVVAISIPVQDGRLRERAIHKSLKTNLKHGREIFDVSLDEAITSMENIFSDVESENIPRWFTDPFIPVPQKREVMNRLLGEKKQNIFIPNLLDYNPQTHSLRMLNH